MSVSPTALHKRGLGRSGGFALWAIASAWLLCASASHAADADAPAALKTAQVALISLADDPRFQARQLELRYPGHPAGRLDAAAQLAVNDSTRRLKRAGWALQWRNVELPNAAQLDAAVRGLSAQGVRYALLDLPAELVSPAVAASAGKTLLFNVSASADGLRGAACAANLFHTIPSDAMAADALAQYLAARNWRKALVLQGPLPADAGLDAAWARAAKRYGIKTTAHKAFKLSGNPAERELANTRLLTNDREHDIVAVWDSDGEFARTLPYATQWPRPVVGSNGLMASAWHAQWPRNGGPQLSRRFRELSGRDMLSPDWAAWLAVKTIAELLPEVGDQETPAQAQHLRGDFFIAGYKGPRLSYRAWNGQLRQPMVLAHADGVIGAAPVEGVLHPVETMDTLGIDQAENTCRIKP